MNRKAMESKNYRMYNENLYEVERVVQIKWVKNKQYCLIKWKGYDEKFNTWEPRDHITFCYNYQAPQNNDQDPQYQEKTPICNPVSHQYQTRTRNRPSSKVTAKIKQIQEKQDRTQLEDQFGAPNVGWNMFPIQKPIKEVNKEEVQIRKKGESQTKLALKQELVGRILQLASEKTNQRNGKVETPDGHIIYLSEEILKHRFPYKVIEYYQRLLRSRQMRCE